MTTIITAWLVKLATRILRNQLEGLHSKIDYLDQNLDTALAEHRRQSQQLKAEAELAHSRGLQLCDALGRIETLSNRCDTFRSQMLDQAATIRDYQLEKENLCCTIDVLQANVSGWSKLFATLEHQVGTSRETAVRLRREIDVFTVRKDSTTGAGSASQTGDSAGGPAGGTAGLQRPAELD